MGLERSHCHAERSHLHSTPHPRLPPILTFACFWCMTRKLSSPGDFRSEVIPLCEGDRIDHVSIKCPFIEFQRHHAFSGTPPGMESRETKQRSFPLREVPLQFTYRGGGDPSEAWFWLSLLSSQLSTACSSSLSRTRPLRGGLLFSMPGLSCFSDLASFVNTKWALILLPKTLERLGWCA